MNYPLQGSEHSHNAYAVKHKKGKTMFIIKLEEKNAGYRRSYYWFTICNSRGQPLTTSEMYVSKQGAEKCIDSFKRNGLKFKVVDNTK